MTVKAAEAWWIEKKNVYLTGLARLAVLSRSSLNIPNKAGRRREDRINAQMLKFGGGKREKWRGRKEVEVEMFCFCGFSFCRQRSQPPAPVRQVNEVRRLQRHGLGQHSPQGQWRAVTGLTRIEREKEGTRGRDLLQTLTLLEWFSAMLLTDLRAPTGNVNLVNSRKVPAVLSSARQETFAPYNSSEDTGTYLCRDNRFCRNHIRE